MATRDRAYTLIELLVSVTIVLVLTVVGVASYASVGKNARDARRKSDLEKIRVALEIRKQEKGTYPINIRGDEGELDSLVGEGYIDSEPVEPRGFSYVYQPNGTFKTYTIQASMELTKNATPNKVAVCTECFTKIEDMGDVACGCVCSTCPSADIEKCSIKGCNYEVKNP